jgi:ankyrin repeat protein
MDINIVYASGATALHLAASFGHGELVSLFLEYQGDVHKANKRGWTALLRRRKWTYESGANVTEKRSGH